ncbi:MAG: hypothetical protein WAM97_20905 [Acidimicrobiales bacterium]|jgi:hypothetical protein
MPFVEGDLPVTPATQKEWPPVNSTMALHLSSIAAARAFYPNHKAGEIDCPDCKAAVVGIAEEFSRWVAQNVETFEPQRDDIVADVGRQVFDGVGATKDHSISHTQYLVVGRACHGSRFVADWLEETGRITDRFEVEKWLMRVVIDWVDIHLRVESRNFN